MTPEQEAEWRSGAYDTMQKWTQATDTAVPSSVLHARRVERLLDGIANQLATIEALRDVLSVLSSYVSAGMGDDATTPQQWNERIRWGIDFLVDATVKRAEQAEQRVAALAEALVAVRTNYAGDPCWCSPLDNLAKSPHSAVCVAAQRLLTTEAPR